MRWAQQPNGGERRYCDGPSTANRGIISVGGCCSTTHGRPGSDLPAREMIRPLASEGPPCCRKDQLDQVKPRARRYSRQLSGSCEWSSSFSAVRSAVRWPSRMARVMSGEVGQPHEAGEVGAAQLLALGHIEELLTVAVDQLGAAARCAIDGLLLGH